MTIKYDAYTYDKGKPIIGEATVDEDGTLSVFLWLQPTNGLFCLKPNKDANSKKGQ